MILPELLDDLCLWQVCKVCKYASIQVCKYASMQVCKYASMQVCNYAIMQVCKYANMQVCKNAICYLLSVPCYMLLANKIFLSETCAYLQKLFPFACCCTSRNFYLLLLLFQSHQYLCLQILLLLKNLVM